MCRNSWDRTKTYIYLNEQVDDKVACFKPPLITGNPKGEILWQPEARD